MRSSGIYKIKCLGNNKSYVGSSIDIKQRWSLHVSELRAHKHVNRYLQFAWNKYKEENFEFEVLEVCSVKALESRELYWINTLQSHIKQQGFNIRFDPSTNRGLKHTKEFGRKISRALKGKPKSFEHNQKVARALKGNKNSLGAYHSAESRQKMSKAQQLRKEEVRHQMLGNTYNTGRKQSRSTVEKRKQTILKRYGPNFYKTIGVKLCLRSALDNN